MQSDRYIKVILTLIAAALLKIAFSSSDVAATAQSPMNVRIVGVTIPIPVVPNPPLGDGPHASMRVQITGTADAIPVRIITK
jgi:hypothetical protein